MATLSAPAVNLEPYILRAKPAGTAYRVEKMNRKCWVQAHARDHDLRASSGHKDCGYWLEGCMGNFHVDHVHHVLYAEMCIIVYTRPMMPVKARSLWIFRGSHQLIFTKTLDYIAGPGSGLPCTLPCQPTFNLHTACQEMVKAASLALQLWGVGFLKRVSTILIVDEDSTVQQLLIIKCHNSYRQVYEWVYSIYIVHSFMHQNLLLLLARWRPSVSIPNCLKYKPLFTFWSCNNVEQLLWSTSATLFCLSGAGITRGWTACLQSGGPVLIGQTDIDWHWMLKTIRNNP